MKSLTFHVLEDGSLDVHHQDEGGPTYSFDPAQLPGNLAALLPKALKAALVAKVAAEERATIAEAKEAEAVVAVEKVAPLIEAQAQLDAKDAIIQDLLAKVADLEVVKTRN